MRFPIALSVLLALSCSLVAGDWPQAAGPAGDFIVEGEAPDDFSVALGKNLEWRVPLPNTGQGAVIVKNGRAFVSSHAPVSEDSELGSLIIGQCFDAATGKELWRRELPGTRETDLSSLFSDNTAASPVATDELVVFTNVGGSIRCFDHDGNEQWSKEWVPFGRHHSRQHEPMIHGDKVILFRVKPSDLDPSVTTKDGAKPLGRDLEYWTWLEALDLATGEHRWWAESATGAHATSILRGDRILTGRGGGHQPPEEPYGVSMLDARTGRTIWDQAIKGYASAQNATWNNDVAALIVGKQHETRDLASGELIKSTSLVKNVQVCRRIDGVYTMLEDQDLSDAKKPMTLQSNLVVGDYHYFRAHADYLIGRVHLTTGKVEYLEVPVQFVRQAGQPEETRWQDPLPNDMRNADGFLATQDKRNAGSGWGHVSAASPIVVGSKIYLPTMLGMVYVLNWNGEVLDESALVSVSDLGPAGQTWSLSSLSFADGKLYARTMRELICIGR